MNEHKIGIAQICEARIMLKQVGRLLLVFMLAGWAGHAAAGPITEVVTVDGNDWAQVDLFANLSWNAMNAACPGGVCSVGGTLNSYDMTGWQWATIDDVNALLNFYIGSPAMGPGPDIYQEVPGAFAALFYADGWRATQHIFPGSSRETIGRMSDDSTKVGYMGEWIGLTSVAHTNYAAANPDVIAPGGWFYRDTTLQVPIPAPATLPLLGLGLAALVFGVKVKARWYRVD